MKSSCWSRNLPESGDAGESSSKGARHGRWPGALFKHCKAVPGRYVITYGSGESESWKTAVKVEEFWKPGSTSETRSYIKRLRKERKG